MVHEASLREAMAERMRPLRAHYFESLRQRMQVIERALVMLVSDEFNQPQDRRALQTEVHKLAGTGATYGFPKISEAAKALENTLIEQVSASADVLLDLVADLMNVCHEALAESISAVHRDAAPAEGGAGREPGWTVLVVDDDEDVRELLAHKLRRAGCQVSCAEDGAKAWRLLQMQTYSLVVLDQMMPGHDGMSLLRMMKTHPAAAHTPVVFLTARDLSTDVLEGLNTGAADYITKPFNSDEVVTRCTRLLRPTQSAMRM
jgi:CheY-like chemotaxis protein/HPt (histidine-containing phosphotransfer) domain-containing protein